MKELVTVLLGVSLTCVLSAGDWPKWLGPSGNSMVEDTNMVTSIPDRGLITKWEHEVGLGYGGPSVADGRVYLMDYIKVSGELSNNPGTLDELTGTERVLCFDSSTGKLLWKFEYNRPYKMSYPAGPRCTPIVDGGLVYALGAEGDLNCLDAITGKVVWSKNFNRDYGAETPVWGHSAHPLVHGDTLYCVVGGDGSVAVAFDKKTGKEKWRALSASSQGYCPPTIITHNGMEQLIIWHPEGVNGLNPATGEVYWSEEMKPTWGGSIQAPQVVGNKLFVAGPGVAGLFELKTIHGKPGVEMLWRGNPRNAVYPVNGNIIFGEDAIYAVDQGASALTAISIEDGSRLWETQQPVLKEVGSKDRHGTAFLIRIGNTNTFYVLSETGDLILAELTAAGYREMGRQNVIEPTNSTWGRPVVWSYPAFAERSLFTRNDKKLVAVDLNRNTYTN
jgi:outer membrane protein assembly factor BamB